MSKLASLTKVRRAHVESCIKNGDNSHKTIADLYSRRTHFVYELLQNADDAGASEAVFNLSAESLEFKHNGEPFSFQDVKAITSVGASPKENSPNSIGKFGVGFKSVFAVTKSPKIYSGKYQFTIVDFIVPEEMPGENVGGEQTLIVLPFNHKSNAPEKSYGQLEGELSHLRSESLLFLRHIKSIRWQTKTDAGEYRVESDTDTDKRIVSSVDGKQASNNYLIFSSEAKIAGKDIRLSVAYRLDDDCRSVVALDDSPLFVFFPVEVMRNAFKFLAHAPYKTTPNRETIPFDDDENQEITAELSALIARSILQVKERELLDVDFLSLLPIDDPDNEEPPYQAAFDKVKALLKENAALPAAGGKYAVAEDALLARGQKLTKLLDSDNCVRLFQRGAWLDTRITADNAPQLRKYLMEHLSIPEKGMVDFCNELDEDFVSAQSDGWLVNFYIAVDENDALYRKSPYSPGILRKKPIIRLENDSHVCPDDEQGEIHVYLPPKSGESRFRTVKRHIANNKRAREFLDKLGVHEPNIMAEIKECIRPKYAGDTGNITEAEYLQDFRYVCDKWSQGSDRMKDDIERLFGEVEFIGSFSHEVQFSLRQPKEVYAQNEATSMWFENNRDDDLYFLAECISDDDGFVKFAEKLGVLSNPHIEGKSNHHRRHQHPFYFKGLNGFNPEFDVEGLEFALRNINIARSIYIFNELALPYASKLSGIVHKCSRQDFREDGWCNERLTKQSSAGKLLINEHWLYDKSGYVIEKPLSEVSADDLCEQYDRDHENFEKLVESLELMPDFIKKYEEKTGKKLVSMTPEQYAEWKAQSQPSEQSSDGWEEDVAPEYVSPEQVPGSQSPVQVKEPEHASVGKAGGGATTGVSGSVGQSEINRPSATDLMKIGDWGERCARSYIESQHPDAKVEWLNEGRDLGRGCDYQVRENGQTYYYEVKSRVDERPTVFEVTNAQWSLAQKLHTNGEGDQYRILLVSNAGKASAKLQEFKDPVGLWKAGKIYAHPVSIRLPPEN